MKSAALPSDATMLGGSMIAAQALMEPPDITNQLQATKYASYIHMCPSCHH